MTMGQGFAAMRPPSGILLRMAWSPSREFGLCLPDASGAAAGIWWFIFLSCIHVSVPVRWCAE
jgi:hypothetical protein